MAEVILESVAESVTGHIVSLISQEIGQACGVKSALKNLKNTVSAITSVLSEAEKRRIEADDIKDWLKKLGDMVYDADDLLDDFSTEALHRRLMGENRLWKEVRIFFSSSNRVFYSFKMAHQVKAIREKLDAIYKDKLHFGLPNPVVVGDPAASGSRVTNVVGNRKEKRVRADTTPYSCEPFVIGRDEDKRKICDFLFDSTPDENVSVLPIVGIGGLGKTTLAKLIFNDKSVEAYFELKLWVCVSEEFDVDTIVEKIEVNYKDNKKSEDGSTDNKKYKLPEILNGKKYLLVLDDVWNDNRHEWLKLKGYLKNGAKGSKILVTTRNESVAKTMNRTYHHSLEGLPDDESISLLMRMADKPEHEWKNQRLETIGREIARKCAGVPLAITTVGRLLYSRDTEEDWQDFISRDLAELKQERSDILPVLKLSYDPLPSYLKQCFTYCSLFPKDYELDPDELIHLWMAQGFIRSPEGSRTQEDVGRECFVELVWRSFFQDLVEDEYGNIISCKMHDLIHDLAQSVAGNNYVTLDSSNAGNFCKEGPRHASALRVKDLKWEGEGNNRIRTFLCLDFSSEAGYEADHWEKLTSGFRNLRALCLWHNQNDMPKSIGTLKHLRLLNLSWCEGLKALPSSISQLHNLETLSLKGCQNLTELPRGITKLVNLRTLDIWDCRQLTHLPKGMGKLTNLQVLSTFVVGRKGDSDAAALDELGRLLGLRKNLSIRQLERVDELICFPVQNLKLQSLELSFSELLERQMPPKLSVREEAYLERLQPHSDLKGLRVDGYIGCRFPSWISQLHKLVQLSIIICHRCRRLPQIHHLPLLKSLKLQALIALEYIEFEERGNQSPAFFPSLMEVHFGNLPVFKGWQWMQGGCRNSSSVGNGTQQVDNDIMLPVFPERIEGSIRDCPMFSYVWHGDLSLTNVAEELMDQLMINSKGQAPPKEEVMATSPSLMSLSSALTVGLKSLRVKGTGTMKIMPEEFFRPLTSTQRLEIINVRHLKTLPWRAIPRYLPALKYLYIGDCPELDLSSVVEDEDEADMRLHHGQFQHRSNLKVLEIGRCDGLQDLSALICCLTSLEELTITGPFKLTFNQVEFALQWIEHLNNLEQLNIWEGENLKPLLEAIHSLRSLRHLKLRGCQGLKSLSRRTILHLITTLDSWHMHSCDELDLNGEELDGDGDMANSQLLVPTTLRSLIINGNEAEFLPWWMEQLNSLEDLEITAWGNLKAIPEWFTKLTSLRSLAIYECPLITDRFLDSSTMSSQSTVFGREITGYAEMNGHIEICFRIAGEEPQILVTQRLQESGPNPGGDFSQENQAVNYISTPPQLSGNNNVVKLPFEALENGKQRWEHSLVGRFVGHASELVIAMVNGLCGKRSRVVISRKGVWSVFQFDDPNLLNWVLESSPWYPWKRLLLLQKWSPDLIGIRICWNKISLWVILRNIRMHLYSNTCINYIASAIGKPLYMDKGTTNLTHLDFARKCVEVDAGEEIEKVINVDIGEEELVKVVLLRMARDLSLRNVAEELIDQLVRNSKGQASLKEELMSVSSSLISLFSALTAGLKSLRVKGTVRIKIMPEEFFHPLTPTQRLEIMNGRYSKSLPCRAILRYLPALEYLCIRDCPELDLSSVVEDEAEADMQLQHGHIDCRILIVCHCLGGFSIYQILSFWKFIYVMDYRLYLNSFAACLTSLKELTIRGCSRLKSMPRRVILHLLTALESLEICNYPEVDLKGEPDLDEEDDDKRANLQFIGRLHFVG